ncbi:Hpt domain-containing protein [Marinomonas transparens]|uniref:Hpt domain-containing protein n=1 Tax=Marinomonas transparens TaxID=2795388 RepID=A0A934N182_9GAMM|nr:Hpt domain-containing protein [Marinomonas transparens]MBJ7536423.1 Hpt domain-containing protein [Marinomonas transparens]
MIDKAHLDNLIELLGKDTINNIRLDYVTDSAEKMTLLLTAWQAKNYDDLAHISHSLKSASANMSLPLLAEQCRIIETSASHEKEEGIQAAVDQLPELYQQSLQALADYFAD